VVGGLRRFDHLNAGYLHTCGVTRGGLTFCWGWNGAGQLGNGTTTDQLTPVQLGVALEMRQVSAGVRHTCGVTTGNRAYCWGGGGRNGDGTNAVRLLPVPVVAPM
jgi:alpha-tubulin suppressor-like RCC1 family protein